MYYILYDNASVVGEPENIEVLALEWEEQNIDHIRRHGLTPDDVEHALPYIPKFFRNLEGRGGTHVMIGVDPTNRSLYVSLVETREPEQWRVITGWRSRLARRLYREG